MAISAPIVKSANEAPLAISAAMPTALIVKALGGLQRCGTRRQTCDDFDCEHHEVDWKKSNWQESQRESEGQG